MSAPGRAGAAAGLMAGFARDTGLGSDAPPRRYLWTDAFAVCNDLGLYHALGDESYLARATDLVDQVHRVLGRHRDDDPREGWISGLSEEEGRRHPTAGGLRIGKPLPERQPGEPYDPHLEWERDGQYYHYLTKWAHALDRVWRVTGEPTCHAWAVELSEGAHRGFLADEGPGATHLFWKASVDLGRPLVPSAGHHDPLDGLLTLSMLEASAPELALAEPLAGPIRDLAGMCRGARWVTDDPLGAGGLLVDLYRCQLLGRTEWLTEGGLLETLVDDALASVEYAAREVAGGRPLGTRLAFREIGFAVGLRAAERLLGGLRGGSTPHAPIANRLEALERHVPLAGGIEAFWLDPDHQEARGWREHADISRVMLATSLLPDGFLGP